VWKVLAWQWRHKREADAKATRILEEARILPTRTVGWLTERQKTHLLAVNETKREEIKHHEARWEDYVDEAGYG
jgi:hypothetical protein